jgi:hypothetical protein
MDVKDAPASTQATLLKIISLAPSGHHIATQQANRIAIAAKLRSEPDSGVDRSIEDRQPADAFADFDRSRAYRSK